jgi:hypothetical protein
MTCIAIGFILSVSRRKKDTEVEIFETIPLNISKDE